MAASLLVAQLAIAGEPLAYKASKLGISLTRFLALNPEFNCAPIEVGKDTTCTSKSSTYAGFGAERVTAFFLDGKLSYVDVNLLQRPDASIAIFAFGTVQEALAGTYGAPARVNDTQGGLVRTMSIWRTEGSTIQLSHSESGASHNVGVMIYRDDHWERSVNQRKSKAKSDV